MNNKSFHTDLLSCLLADIKAKTGFRGNLWLPDDLDDWFNNLGPRLDKELLELFELHEGALEGAAVMTDHNYRPVKAWVSRFPECFAEFAAFAFNSVVALKWLRTLCLFGYKLKREATQLQVEFAVGKFIAREAVLAGKREAIFSSDNRHLLAEMRRSIGRVIYRCDGSKLIDEEGNPLVSHGPGSTFPKVDPTHKSEFSSIYRSIEAIWPFCDWFIGVPSLWEPGILDRQSQITECDTIRSSLVAVPKDSRGPRLISVHPREAIWIQQGIRRQLETAINRSPLTRGRVNFDDQTINQRLARESSVDRYFCTLDMKDASDNIHKDLVTYLFGGYSKYLNACRAETIDLSPYGGSPTHTLEMFAPMGNATTFPVESLIFWACVRASIRLCHGRICDEVYVFGDDIIFPSKYRECVEKGLARAGFVTNSGKTFSAGFFRESCGVDAYRGFDVTPFRLRDDDYTSVEGAVALCDLAKRMVQRDPCSLVANCIYKWISTKRALYVSNDINASGVFRYEDADLAKLLRSRDAIVRWRERYHRWEVQIHQAKVSQKRPPIGAWWPLLDALTRMGEAEATLAYALPFRVKLKKGWTPVK